MGQIPTQFGYRRHGDQDRVDAAHHPVVVVGAGPVGLSLAIDLAQRGQSVVLLDDADRIGEGSRGICFSKRTLEIWDRLGVAERMVDKGVTWKLGKVFLGDELLYRSISCPRPVTRCRPSSICSNIMPKKALVDRVAARCRKSTCAGATRSSALEQHNDHVRLTIDTPDGPYRLAPIG